MTERSRHRGADARGQVPQRAHDAPPSPRPPRAPGARPTQGGPDAATDDRPPLPDRGGQPLHVCLRSIDNYIRAGTSRPVRSPSPAGARTFIAVRDRALPPRVASGRGVGKVAMPRPRTLPLDDALLDMAEASTLCKVAKGRWNGYWKRFPALRRAAASSG